MNCTPQRSANANHLSRSELTMLGLPSTSAVGRRSRSYTRLLSICKLSLPIHKSSWLQSTRMSKSYRQYCPIAHALDLVGDRWSLLVVRELLAYGPRRYSDLANHLEGCGTNILAARLKDLERHGVVEQATPASARSVDRLRADPVRRGAAPGRPSARALGPSVAASADSSRRASPGLAPGRPAHGVSRRARRTPASSSASATSAPRSSAARCSTGPQRIPMR